ncbi:helix-turn-helix domain-containing protein [Halobacteria archaeon AArc-dxtr1]|nr:helix-turn-helix domain-containing protein [Halobacteria archaeon AArc-dxtr1]
MTNQPANDDSTRDGEPVPPGPLARRIFERSPTSIAVVDSTGTIVFVNERATETFGRSRESLTGRPYDSLEWNLYDDSAPAATDEHPIARVFATNEPEFGFEQWLTHPDGSERWVTSNAAPLGTESGEAAYVVVTFEDVTRVKRREERLLSDHMRRLEFRTDESAVPPSLRVTGGERRLDVESVVSLPDGATIQYMGTSDLSASEFVTAIEEVPHFVDVRLLSTAEGYSRIEARAEDATVAEVFQSLGGRPRGMVVSRDEVRFFGELPGDADHRAAAEWIEEFHSGVELVSEELVYSPHLLYDVVADALTDRQLAVLDAAYFSGYFDTPRTSTGDELAARFDVTRQTFNQHLRKAQRTVLRYLFEESSVGSTD